VEADLLRYYGVDLLEYYRGRLSARRLAVLIRHLPREAALVRAVRGDEVDWGLAEHLLAVAADRLAEGNWMFAAAHTSEGTDPPKRPEPIPRPGVAPAEADIDGATPGQIAAFFGVST
jgi:hypothetical protein